MSDEPILLDSGEYQALEFALGRRAIVEYEVRSSQPVSVHLVDDDDLADYESGEGFSYFVGARNRKRHFERLRLPAGRYFVVIENEGVDPAAAVCDLYY
ncbi:MAG: hypothetical protein L0216_00080 [Planctomycetales bacterium]|nr:hypothetical protein [Planctomycetales bacterium]